MASEKSEDALIACNYRDATEKAVTVTDARYVSTFFNRKNQIRNLYRDKRERLCIRDYVLHTLVAINM